MSNGQAEIERLEAATSAFEAIITTEEDSVEVPNVGPTPSLKKRVEEGLDERVPGPHVYMQSANSDVDEYGYPLRTLYKNGDGMIVYYPEYSVFRKYGSGWQRIDPHVRNVVNFNGTTQYATVPRVAEIDLDDPDLEFEIEWRCETNDTQYAILGVDSDNDSFTDVEFEIAVVLGRLYLYMGGSANSLIDYDNEANTVVIVYKNGMVTVFLDGNEVAAKVVSIGNTRSYKSMMTIGGFNTGSSMVRLLDGKVSNLRIWAGGDRNTGTLIRDYRMDEGWRTNGIQLLVNYATDLGEELVLPEWQNFDTLPIGQSKYTYYEEIASGEVQGVDYLFSFGVSNFQGSQDVGMLSGNYFKSPIKLSVNFAKREILTRVGTGGAGLFNRVVNQCTFENVTMKQADGYGEYIGFTEASWTRETV